MGNVCIYVLKKPLLRLLVSAESFKNGFGLNGNSHAFLRGKPIVVQSLPFGQPRFLIFAGT